MTGVGVDDAVAPPAAAPKANDEEPDVDGAGADAPNAKGAAAPGVALASAGFGADAVVAPNEKPGVLTVDGAAPSFFAGGAPN